MCNNNSNKNNIQYGTDSTLSRGKKRKKKRSQSSQSVSNINQALPSLFRHRSGVESGCSVLGNGTTKARRRTDGARRRRRYESISIRSDETAAASDFPMTSQAAPRGTDVTFVALHATMSAITSPRLTDEIWQTRSRRTVDRG